MNTKKNVGMEKMIQRKALAALIKIERAKAQKEILQNILDKYVLRSKDNVSEYAIKVEIETVDSKLIAYKNSYWLSHWNIERRHIKNKIRRILGQE